MIFTGTCNTELFNIWIEQMLLPELEPGQVIIMDNVRTHKSKKTKELIESVGCKLIFLPTYSPDFNPIEKFWANLKNTISEILHSSNNLSLSEAIIEGFKMY